VNPEIAALEIQDDGVGFDIGAVTGSYENRGSLGMVNMRERTELVNGVLHMDSAPGKGTKITVLVPLTEEAREKLGNL
jgi:signal transduction histidine kinase